MCGVPIRMRVRGMKLDERELRMAFRAVVGRIAAGGDEVARARWWRWVEEAAPPARETNPGRLVISLGDVMRAQGIHDLERYLGRTG